MDKRQYDTTAAWLHWLTVLMLVALFSVAFGMEAIDDRVAEREAFGQLVTLHKSLGITLFFLILARLAWRFTHKAPPWPDGMPRWQKITAGAVHHTLYLLLLLQPLSGYLSSSFSGYKTSLWGVPLPHWGHKNEMLNEFFSEAHEIIAFTLLTLVCVHIVAALSHQLLPAYQAAKGRMPPFRLGKR